MSFPAKCIVRFVLRRCGRFMKWPISRRCFPIRVPAVLRRTKHLIHAHDAPVVVDALTSVDFEDLRIGHVSTERRRDAQIDAARKPNTNQGAKVASVTNLRSVGTQA